MSSNAKKVLETITNRTSQPTRREVKPLKASSKPESSDAQSDGSLSDRSSEAARDSSEDPQEVFRAWGLECTCPVQQNDTIEVCANEVLMELVRLGGSSILAGHSQDVGGVDCS
jgi:hypothetical protein